VLLYYKYTGLDSAQRNALREWYQETCTALGLRGRVRVAFDGVNVTVRALLAPVFHATSSSFVTEREPQSWSVCRPGCAVSGNCVELARRRLAARWPPCTSTSLRLGRTKGSAQLSTTSLRLRLDRGAPRRLWRAGSTRSLSPSARWARSAPVRGLRLAKRARDTSSGAIKCFTAPASSRAGQASGTSRVGVRLQASRVRQVRDTPCLVARVPRLHPTLLGRAGA